MKIKLNKEQLLEIFRINNEKLKKLLRGYNPITGENAPGKRVAVTISDFLEGKPIFVPVEMMDDLFFRALVKVGSIKKYIERYTPLFDCDTARETILRRLIRLRCKHDFYYFAYVFARIKNKDGGDDIPFYLRPAQVKLIRIFERMRLGGIPIRVILLKCRQWGGSTATDIYMAWLQIFWRKNWNSNIVGHQSTSATQVFDMYEKLINALPLWIFYDIGEEYKDDIRKIKTSPTTQNIKYMVPRDCKIQTGSARNPESTRSGDAALVHITEEAFFPDTTQWHPRDIIKAASSAVKPAPYTFIVRESTPNGRENDFHDEWVRAKSKDKDGNPLSAYKPVFVAWFEIEDYILPFSNKQEKINFIQWLFDNQEDTQGHGKYYYWLWKEKGATLEGIKWYITKLKEYASIDDMKQEYPSDDIEAFLYSGITVFDPYKLEEMEAYCQEMPILVGDIEGAAYQATDKNCMHNIRITEQSGGPLKVWELPDTDEHVLNRYLVSCDIGGAHRTSDFSDIVVIDRYDCLYGGVPAVVAEWHGHCDPDQLAMKCAQIASFYNNAFLVIESNTAYSRMNNTEGDPSELFFPILLPLYDNLYNSSHSKLLKRKPKELRWGYHTSRSTKSAMIKYLQKVIRDKGYIEREQRALDEYSYFMFYNQNNTFGAVAGKHDDRVMARAIALYVEKDMDAPKIVEWKSPEQKKREQELKKKPVAPELAIVG